jgi:hypothetical protein
VELRSTEEEGYAMKPKTFIGLTLFTALLCLIPVAAISAGLPDLHRRVTALERAVATLQTTVSTLQGQVQVLQDAKTEQQAIITTLQNRVTALSSSVSALRTGIISVRMDVATIKSNSVLALGPYLTVDTTKKLVLFQGVNLQLVNGANFTSTRNGLGNLIIGYDLPRSDGTYFCSDGQYATQADCEGANETWAVSLKTGSHYLVIGDENNYSQWGGLVVGNFNTSNGTNASVSGGAFNTASGTGASVSGGSQHSATGTYNWVGGPYSGQ